MRTEKQFKIKATKIIKYEYSDIWAETANAAKELFTEMCQEGDIEQTDEDNFLDNFTITECEITNDGTEQSK